MPPEVKLRVRSVKNLCAKSNGGINHPLPAHLIEDVDEDRSTVVLQHHVVRTLLGRQHLGEVFKNSRAIMSMDVGRARRYFRMLKHAAIGKGGP